MSDDNALTEEELKWMDAVLAECRSQGVMPHNRYELAAYAIVCKGNCKKAVARLSKMRKIEAEYKLEELDIETAGSVVDVSNPPGCFMAAGADDLGRPMWYMDYAAFKPKNFETEREWNCLVKVSMCSFECLTSTIKQIREGSVMVASGAGMGWGNFSLEMEKRFSAFYQDGFPIKIKSMIIMDPPVIISAIIKLCRVFLKKKTADRLAACSRADVLSKKVGCISAGQLPPHAGGSYAESAQAWLARGLARRAASEKELGPVSP